MMIWVCIIIENKNIYPYQSIFFLKKKAPLDNGLTSLIFIGTDIKILKKISLLFRGAATKKLW
jgi:hypothetical protein